MEEYDPREEHMSLKENRSVVFLKLHDEMLVLVLLFLKSYKCQVHPYVYYTFH